MTVECKICEHEDNMTEMLMLLSEEGEEEMYCVACCITECKDRGYSLTKVPANELANTIDAINIRIQDKLDNGKKTSK